SAQGHDLFRLEEYGRRPRRLGSREFRPPSSADRHRSAAARPADPERLQPSPLRRRADGSHGDPPARAAYPSASARRRKPRASQPAGDVEADSGLREQARRIARSKIADAWAAYARPGKEHAGLSTGLGRLG